MLLIRANASTKIGSGHVMRCLALAQAWQDLGGEAAFLCSEMPESLISRLQVEKCNVRFIHVVSGSEADAKQTIAVADELSASWVVVDGYDFDVAYQRELKAAGLRVLLIDDYGSCSEYAVDLVLNQNLGAEKRWYRHRSADTKLLLGPRYALLRREFLRRERTHKATPDVARHILITLGGSDPDNVSLQILKAWEQVDQEDLHLKLVVGGGNPHSASLVTAASQSRHLVELVHDVRDMSALMEWADLAVCAGGSSNWEMCYFGIPRLAVVLAENQAGVCRELEKTGCLQTLNSSGVNAVPIARWVESMAEGQIEFGQIAIANQCIVDGRGSTRVVRRLKSGSSLCRRAEITLRDVVADDSELILQWANDPSVRQASFNSQPILKTTHESWFREKLQDLNCVHFIANDANDLPVGQIRFECDPKQQSATVHLSVAPGARGKGVGQAMLESSMRRLFNLTETRLIAAQIRVGNCSSLHAFLALGFTVESTRVNEQGIAHWSMEFDRADWEDRG